jgi:hypothetical protein
MIEIRIYCEEDGSCPFKKWLDKQNYKVAVKASRYIEELGHFGYQLHRPYSENLGNGIYELRPTYQGIHYRILYFFHGREIAIITGGLVKEKRIPEKELNIAVNRMKKYKLDPEKYSINLFKDNQNWKYRILNDYKGEK